MISRRGFLGFLAAPAIVRIASLMPIKALPPPSELDLIIEEERFVFGFTDWRGIYGTYETS